MHPRYLALYDYDAADQARAEQLFDLFLKWQGETPRTHFQLGIIELQKGKLLGSAGLRCSGSGTPVLGIELAPDEWGRFRLALHVADALLSYGIGDLRLETIIGDTASGNRRVEKLAKRFGARIADSRAGPSWMQARGWREVDWALDRADWERRTAELGLPGT